MSDLILGRFGDAANRIDPFGRIPGLFIEIIQPFLYFGEGFTQRDATFFQLIEENERYLGLRHKVRPGVTLIHAKIPQRTSRTIARSC